jgi:hypothetical protein
VEDPEIDLVGPVRIGRVTVRLDVGSIVVEHVEDEVALMLVRADDLGIDGHVIGHQGIGAHPFVQPEVLGRMPRIDRIDLRFDALTVAAGVQDILNIVEENTASRAVAFVMASLAACRVSRRK